MKLYSRVDLESYEEDETLEGVETSEETVDSDLELVYEIDEDISEVGVGIESALSNIDMIGGMQDHIKSKKIGSREYLVSIESYKVVIDRISDNLGLSRQIPSLESFSSPYGLMSSHQIATEGFRKMMARFWKQVKDLFKRFFDKIKQFFRVLTKANLKIDEYDKALEVLVPKINNLKDPKYKGPKVISSELPTLLGNSGLDKMTLLDFMNHGRHKLVSLKVVVDRINENLDGMNRDMESVNSLISDLISSDSLEDARQVAAGLKEVCSGIPKNFLRNSVTDNGANIPHEALGDINEGLGSVGENTELLSLVAGEREETSLPRHYNVFYGMDKEKNVAMAVTNKETTHVSNTLEPLMSASEVSEFYNIYKDLRSGNYIKKVERFSNSSKKQSDKLFETVTRKIIPEINRYEDLLKSSTVARDDVVYYQFPDSKLELWFYFVDEQSGCKIDARYDNGKIVERILSATDLMVNDTVVDIINKIAVLSADVIFAKKVEEQGGDWKEAVKHHVREKLSAEPVEPDAVSAPDTKERSDVLIDIQSYLRLYISVHKNLTSALLRDLPRLYVECRYELAKYIYSCAKQFR